MSKQTVQEILSPYSPEQQQEIGEAVGYLSKATEYVAKGRQEDILKCAPYLAQAMIYMLKYTAIFQDESKTFTLIMYAIEGEHGPLN